MANVADQLRFFQADPDAFARGALQGQQFRANQGNMQRQNALAEIGPAAFRGDENALAQLSGIDPEMAFKVRDQGRDNERLEKERMVGNFKMFSNAVRTADTPEAYTGVVRQFYNMGILDDEDLAQIPPFEGRQTLIDTFTDLETRIGAERDARDFEFKTEKEGRRRTEFDLKQALDREKMEKKGGGITVTSPDGTVMQVGGAGGSLERRTRGELEGRELDSRTQLARLTDIETMMAENPALSESLTLGGRAERALLEGLDMIDPDLLTPEDKVKLTEITELRADVLANLNQTIKDITGAAMTVPEAKRIGATVPGVKDGPTVFNAKLKQAIRRTKMAVARYNYWRKTGMADNPWDVASLEDMEGLLKKRGAELYDDAKRRGLEGDDAKAEAARALSAEFGI